MKIYDCFMFNNEDLVLKIRLNYLYNHIYKFIIVESKYDHQGKIKSNFFNIEKYKKFNDKIEYLFIDKFPKNLSNWQRENFQRNFIENAIQDINDDDYVMISDVDEIPNIEKFKKNFRGKYSVFEQKNFFYKLNLANKTIPKWYGSKICKKKYLKNPQWLRNQKIKNISIFNFYRIKWNIIKDGGWHFSFLMKPKEIQRKIKSFAHSEFNKEEFTNLDKITYRLNNRLDIFDRKQFYNKVKLDDDFPQYIKENLKEFKEWLL
jgi:beta-1,4-mannosyl-glycoprotein beta-1,4-N-acetylglucosaminyltransferase